MQNQTLSPRQLEGEIGHGGNLTSRAWGKMDMNLDGIKLNDLRPWNGNIVTSAILHIISGSPLTWFGCHWSEWQDICMVSPYQYFQARNMLVGTKRLRVERINIPFQRQYVLCHTLDMDAEPPEWGKNLWIWGKD